MYASIGGTDMVFVSGEYPWRLKTKQLLALADRDPHVAMGLDVYNAMSSDDPVAVMGAVAYYNDAVACGGGCGKKVAGTVREAARCQMAAEDEADGVPPLVLGLPIRDNAELVGFNFKKFVKKQVSEARKVVSKKELKKLANVRDYNNLAKQYARRLKPSPEVIAAGKAIGKGAYKISRHPALPIVAAALPGVGPGVAGGIVAYQAAMKGVDLARAGKGAEALAAMSSVAAYAAQGNPQAQEALANIRKGAAIVKDVQKMGKSSPAELTKLIADRAGVDVKSIAQAYGVPVNAVTSDAISKLAQGKLPDVVSVPAALKTPAGRAAAQILQSRGIKPDGKTLAAVMKATAQQAPSFAVPGAPGKPAGAPKGLARLFRMPGMPKGAVGPSAAPGVAPIPGLTPPAYPGAPSLPGKPGAFICQICHPAGGAMPASVPMAAPKRKRSNVVRFF